MSSPLYDTALHNGVLCKMLMSTHAVSTQLWSLLLKPPRLACGCTDLYVGQSGDEPAQAQTAPPGHLVRQSTVYPNPNPRWGPVTSQSDRDAG